MVLNEAYYVVLLRRFDEFVVVLEQLDGGLRDQDVQATLDSIQRNTVVSALDNDEKRFGVCARITDYPE